MILKIDYFDNKLKLGNNFINVIEVENKKYFYRFVNDFYEIVKNGFANDLNFFSDEGEEMNMNGRLKLYIDYFDLGFDSKKNITDLSKYVLNSIDENDMTLLQNQYNKIVKIYKKVLNDIDLPLFMEEEVNIEAFSKILKLGINTKFDLLDNLFLLIDIEKAFKNNNVLIFVNLKQYLSREELKEFYKYAIYNQVQILLIDSQSYGGTLDYEKKLIIDVNLDEFMI